MRIKLVALALLTLALTARAQAPTADTFSLSTNTSYLSDNGTIAVNLLTQWDGAYPPSIPSFPGGDYYYYGQYHHLTSGLTDFIVPNAAKTATVNLIGCTSPGPVGSIITSGIYRTVLTDESYACTDQNSTPYTVSTTLAVYQKLSWCRFKACWADVSKSWTGTVSAE
jgi:hypothetical protein